MVDEAHCRQEEVFNNFSMCFQLSSFPNINHYVESKCILFISMKISIVYSSIPYYHIKNLIANLMLSRIIQCFILYCSKIIEDMKHESMTEKESELERLH
ncbi:hypothetical protein KUF71_011874, partial [Frankliniella fusca]